MPQTEKSGGGWPSLWARVRKARAQRAAALLQGHRQRLEFRQQMLGQRAQELKRAEDTVRRMGDDTDDGDDRPAQGRGGKDEEF